MNKMYVTIRCKDKKVAGVPCIWLIVQENGTLKCWWPHYGLTFKLKNMVPPPLCTDVTEMKKWKQIDCEYCFNGKIFKTYKEADDAISLMSDAIKVIEEDTEDQHDTGTASADHGANVATQTNVIEHADAAVSVDHGTDMVKATQTTVVEHAYAAVRDAIFTGADMATQTNTFDVNTNDVQGSFIGEIDSGALGCNIAIDHEMDDIYNAFEMVASEQAHSTAESRTLEINEPECKIIASSANDIIEDLSEEVAVKDMLQIIEIDGYLTLQEFLKVEKNCRALAEVYSSIFATNAEDFAERIMEMTFEKKIRLKIGFCNLNDIINVKDTPLLECWIESVTRKFDTGHNQAKSIIKACCTRFRNAVSQNKCRAKKKNTL